MRLDYVSGLGKNVVVARNTLPKELRQYLSKLGRKGGPARAAAMSKEQRSESARKAVLARWAKAKGQKP